MSKIQVDAIEQQTACGTTLTAGGGAGKTVVVDATTVTLGRCGGTVALASGASQTGFGRTGTVDWQTTPKTATFTAVSGEGYFANTSGGTAFNMNLPAGVAGAIVSVADYAGTWQTTALTVVPNGTDKIGAQNDNAVLTTEGQSVTLVFVDSTQGWINTMDSTSNVRGALPYVTATGGTEVVCGNFKTHIFTGTGPFNVTSGGGAAGSNTVDYLVVAGGGGGNGWAGGGGGAGGFRLSNSYSLPACQTSPLASGTGLAVPVQNYTITVGGGGSPAPQNCNPNPGASPGGVSTFASITSAGGGRAGQDDNNGLPGGSGGGGGRDTPNFPVGAGNTPPTNPSQGNPGGAGHTGPAGFFGGGGGGASASGNTNPPGQNDGGPGGSGSYLSDGFVGPTAPSYGTTSPTSSARHFAGGGGGGNANTGNSAGGDGGGGRSNPSGGGQAGTTNTGGGGGGAYAPSPSSGSAGASGAGGSGIVMIRYKFQN